MESTESGGSSSSSNLVVTELTHIQELVKKLEGYLGDQSCAPVQMCKNLTSQILSSTAKSICMIKCHLGQKRPIFLPDSGIDSPLSGTASPLSEASDLPFKMINKKRKTMPKLKSQVRVSSTGGAEGPMDDGYSWRKYGQKDILGAKHPRGYYRCTYRNTQGCPATKQVQRTDDDPSLLDVIYQGTHTCIHKAGTSQPLANRLLLQQNVQNSSSQDLFQSLSESLTVKTGGFEAQDWNSMPFSFPSTSVGGLACENNLFSSPSTPENRLLCGISPSLASPMTSDSNISRYGEGIKSWKSESDIAEVVSALVTVSSSPVATDLDFMLEQFEFDPDFNLDASSFFV